MPEDTQYIVSARKYRPDSFKDLIGQDNIVRTLKNSIMRHQLAHAYLFCGPRGVGKTSAARIFAKTINCASPTEDMEPCGHCESCVSFQEGRSYCIHELDAASNNGVDDIKALMEQVQIPPQVGRYSVYIIDEVHMLSQAAFNAFLKTLEEPPAHAIFILATTEKHKILPTILSRCQTYDFNRISIPDMVRNLRAIAGNEGISVDDESLHVIARKADGAMRDALTIFDQTVAFCGTDIKYEDVIRNLNVLDYEYSFRMTDYMLAGDYASALMEFDSVLSKGFNALYFVASLSTHFRNLIVAGGGGMDALLELPDSLKKKYKEQAGKCSLRFLYDALTVTSQCESGYKESVNPRLHIEFALMRLCMLKGLPASVHSKDATSNVQSDNAAQAIQPVTVGDASAVAKGQQTQAVEQTSQQPIRRSTSKAAVSLSLDALSSEEEVNKPVADVETLPQSIPEDETIRAKWKELPAQYASRPRLSSSLASSTLEITPYEGGKQVCFFVENQPQKKWIEEMLLSELESKLRELLGTKALKLRVEVSADTQTKKTVYTPEEKLKDIISSNKEVENLVNDLGLDIK